MPTLFHRPDSSGILPKRVWVSTVAAALAVLPAAAQSPPEGAGGPSAPYVTRVGDVPVPVASEIFKTLDMFANSNWRAVQRPELATWRPHGNQQSIALLLGAVIAEGFIAVEAEDVEEVKSLGRAVLTLARGLGVERWALKRSRSIVDHAEAGDWAAVREEWDHVLPDVQEGMNELRSHQLAHLVSLGGWARGTEALAALISQNYAPERAELLRQRVLLEHFEKQLAATSDDKRRAMVLAKAAKRLQQFRGLLDAADTQISAATKKEIGVVAAELLSSLNGQNRKG